MMLGIQFSVGFLLLCFTKCFRCSVVGQWSVLMCVSVLSLMHIKHTTHCQYWCENVSEAALSVNVVSQQ